MKKTLPIIVFACCIFLNVNAQVEPNDQLNPLITGVPFLSITPDARAGGMGDLGVATAPDVNSQYWNAAKYAFMESEAGFSFSFTPWLRQLGITDIYLASLAGYYKFDERQTLSASLRYFSLGDVDIRGYDANDHYVVKPNDFAIDLAYSILLSEKFSGAVALRYIRSDLGNIGGGSGSSAELYPANSVAVDLGAYYRSPMQMATGTGHYNFGLNISNIGNKVSYYDGGEYPNFLPTNLRLGGSFDYPFDDYNTISFSVDLNKLLIPTVPKDENGNYNEELMQEYYDTTPIAGIFKSFSDAPGGFKEELKEIMWSVGAEYAYNKQFFVRAGYFHENEFKGNRKFFTAGVGFKLNVFQLDAGYVISVAQNNPLDQTLRLGLSFDMAGLKSFID